MPWCSRCPDAVRVASIPRQTYYIAAVCTMQEAARQGYATPLCSVFAVEVCQEQPSGSLISTELLSLRERIVCCVQTSVLRG